MGKSINQRISNSFTGDQGVAETRDYAKDVYSSWKDVAQSLSRNSILILVLMAIFELLAYQKQSSNITIDSITISNLPIVQIVLPAVISVMLYDCIRLTGRWNDLENAYCALIEICAPAQHKNDLDLFVKPSLPAIWGVGRDTSPEIITPSEKFISNVTTVFAITIVFIFPFSFEGQAYYRLLQKFGYENILLWISLVVTAAIVVCIVIYVLMRGGED